MKGNRAKVAAWEQSHFGMCTVPDWLDCDVPMQETLQMDIQRVERTISKEQQAVPATSPAVTSMACCGVHLMMVTP